MSREGRGFWRGECVCREVHTVTRPVFGKLPFPEEVEGALLPSGSEQHECIAV